MMELKDYVFYMITKKDERSKEPGYSFGIERSKSCLQHSSYFALFRDMDSSFFEEVPYSFDWTEMAEGVALQGNILIVNTAIEIEDVENRLYGIYLPSFLTEYQIWELQNHMDEFDRLDIDLDVQGEFRAAFLERRMRDDFDSHAFLKSYLRAQEQRLSKVSNVLDGNFQKVMC